MYALCFFLALFLVLLCLAFFILFFFCQLARNRLSSPCSCPCPTHTHTHRGACTVTHTNTLAYPVTQHKSESGFLDLGGCVRVREFGPQALTLTTPTPNAAIAAVAEAVFLIVKLQRKQQLRAAALPRLNVKFSWTTCARNAFDNPFNEFSLINWHSYSLHCN